MRISSACILSLIVSISLLCTMQPVNAESAQKLVLAVEDSWPPFANEQGDGYSKDIIIEAFKDTEIEVEFVLRPYIRALQEAKSGLVDGCFNVTRQQSTEAVYYFGEEPLLEAKASYFILSQDKAPSGVTSLADLPDNTHIAVIKGYEYGDIYEEHKDRFRVTEVRTQSQIIEMMKKGRVDGAIMFDRVAESTLNKMSLPKALIKPVFLNHKSDIYVAFNRENEKSPAIAATLDLGLKQLKATDAYLKIFEKAY